MSDRRFFYITQDSLVVWNLRRTGLQEEITFSSSDEGFENFSTYLADSAGDLSTMVVDVIEEEFVSDTIPKLGTGDRKSLIERRLARKFSRTPYRIGIYQGHWREKGDSQEVLHAAVTNHELIDPWMEIIVRHKTPVAGIYSVPLLGEALLRRLRQPAEHSLFLTQHQGNKLRQVFLQGGKIRSARLSQTPSPDGEEYGSSFFTEVQRGRRYLERTRLLSASDELNIYVVAHADRAKRILAGIENRAEMKVHFIDPDRAGKLAGVPGDMHPDHFEALYLACCASKKPKYRYLMRNKINYAQLARLRHAVIATAASAAVGFSIVSGIMLASGLELQDASRTIESQVNQLQETYRREHDEFQPIKADSHEMKLAVDTGDYILRNTLPVSWVMQQIGTVMGQHSDMHIDGLSWEVEATQNTDSNNTARRPNDRQMPVNIPEIAAVYANLNGQIRPYDGDLRDAFAKIEKLASSLESRTAFESVVVTEFPIDARPQASVSGEVHVQGDVPPAEFSIRLTVRIQNEAG